MRAIWYRNVTSQAVKIHNGQVATCSSMGSSAAREIVVGVAAMGRAATDRSDDGAEPIGAETTASGLGCHTVVSLPALGSTVMTASTAHHTTNRVAALIRGVSFNASQATNATATACQRLFSTATSTLPKAPFRSWKMNLIAHPPQSSFEFARAPYR